MSRGADQHDTLGAIVRDLYREYQRGLQRELQELDVSLPQWVLLRVLWREHGLTQKALSDRLGIHPSTTLDTLRVMEREGIVERRPDAEDGRALRVFLTRKGRELQPVLFPCAEHLDDLAVGGLTEKEIILLRRLLTKVLFNLERAGDKPACG